MAIDSSSEAIRLASQYMGHRYPGIAPEIYFETQSVLEFFPRETDEAYDLVVDCQTLQHFNWLRRADAYKEICRVLKPQGKFWSMCWCGSAEAANRIYAGNYPELDFMLIEDIVEVLRENGLKIVGRPIITTRTYPELGNVMGEWMIIEAVKPCE